MPYSAVAPRLVNPELGLHTLVARAGHNAAYEIDVTLLDAPDHRLIRSGVLLAHRVLDGRGEWFLTAPDWQPLLPKDRIEPMGHADLPEELGDLIRPFRRRAPLGPVAALRCDRREFALRDDDGTTLALLRDDKVTVRRGGLTTARYREVMVTPVGPGLSEDQQAWVERALLAAGSTVVARFPRLVTRLGAPATGPTDVPELAPFDLAGSVRKFLGQLLGFRLRRLVEADLAVRGGDPTGDQGLLGQARQLRAELDALALVVPADWLTELVGELDWLTGEPGAVPDRLSSRLRSERYLTLLDALVTAARAPRLGEAGTAPGHELLTSLLQAAVARAGSAVADAVAAPSAAAWTSVAASFSRMGAATTLTCYLLPDRAAAVASRLERPRRLLAEVRQASASEQEAAERAATLSPAEAFAAGRAYEQQAEAARRSQVALARAWAKAERKLARQVAR